MILVDTNVILDLFTEDAQWLAWSERQILHLSKMHKLCINPVIFAELSPQFSSQLLLEKQLAIAQIEILDLPLQAVFLAGKIYSLYRKQSGTKNKILADFFIGAHASVLGCELLTRDKHNYAAYFPHLKLIAP